MQTRFPLTETEPSTAKTENLVQITKKDFFASPKCFGLGAESAFPRQP